MGGFWRLSRELAPSQADWFELARFRAAASRRLPGHDLASRLALLPFPCRNIESHASRIVTRGVSRILTTPTRHLDIILSIVVYIYRLFPVARNSGK